MGCCGGGSKKKEDVSTKKEGISTTAAATANTTQQKEGANNSEELEGNKALLTAEKAPLLKSTSAAIANKDNEHVKVSPAGRAELNLIDAPDHHPNNPEEQQRQSSTNNKADDDEQQRQSSSTNVLRPSSAAEGMAPGGTRGGPGYTDSEFFRNSGSNYPHPAELIKNHTEYNIHRDHPGGRGGDYDDSHVESNVFFRSTVEREEVNILRDSSSIQQRRISSSGTQVQQQEEEVVGVKQSEVLQKEEETTRDTNHRTTAIMILQSGIELAAQQILPDNMNPFFHSNTQILPGHSVNEERREKCKLPEGSEIEMRKIEEITF